MRSRVPLSMPELPGNTESNLNLSLPLRLRLPCGFLKKPFVLK